MRTTVINCAVCNAPKTVKIADINRGWGKYCSKSCKQKHQESKKLQAVNL